MALFPPKSSKIVVRPENHVAVGVHSMCAPIWRRATIYRFVYVQDVCVHTHASNILFCLRGRMQIVGYRNRRLTASVHMRLTTSMYMHNVFTTGARAMDEQKLWYALCSNYDGDLNPQSINVA